MQLSETKEQRDAKVTEAKELRHELLEKEQKIRRLSEKVHMQESQLWELQQQAIKDEAVEEQVDEVMGKASVLRVELAEAERERHMMAQNVELALWNEKQLQDWMASLQQIIVSVYSTDLLGAKVSCGIEC